MARLGYFTPFMRGHQGRSVGSMPPQPLGSALAVLAGQWWWVWVARLISLWGLPYAADYHKPSYLPISHLPSAMTDNHCHCHTKTIAFAVPLQQTKYFRYW